MYTFIVKREQLLFKLNGKIYFFYKFIIFIFYNENKMEEIPILSKKDSGIFINKLKFSYFINNYYIINNTFIINIF